jgi:hypothetical protein
VIYYIKSIDIQIGLYFMYQIDINNQNHVTFAMKSNVLTITVTVTAALIAMIGVMSYPVQEVSAQNMTKMGDHGDFWNMTSAMQEIMINGTINLEQTIFDAIGSKINTTLTQAVTTAEQTIGNNSFAMAAFGGPHGDYLVYTIILGTPEMEFHKIIVDPGTGQVLASQELSHEEWIKMQQMHHMMHTDKGSGHGGGGMMMMGDDGGPMMKYDRQWN